MLIVPDERFNGLGTSLRGDLNKATSLPFKILSVESKPNEDCEKPPIRFKNHETSGLISTIVKNTERDVIFEVMQKAKNRSEAIKMLGISRRTFYTKIKQYHLE